MKIKIINLSLALIAISITSKTCSASEDKSLKELSIKLNELPNSEKIYALVANFFNSIFSNKLKLKICNDAEITVEGLINYSGYSHLTEDHTIYVSINDISIADKKSIKLSEQIIKSLSQFPIKYSLQLNPDSIREWGTYSLSVKIEKNGNLEFTTDRNYPITENGKIVSKIDIEVIKVNSHHDSQKSISGFINFESNSNELIDPNSYLEISVIDFSISDAPYTKLGKQIIQNPTKFPIAYHVNFDSTAITKYPNGNYGLEVGIWINNALRFVNVENYLITNGPELLSTKNVSVVKIKNNVSKRNTFISGIIDCDLHYMKIEAGSLVYISVEDVSRADGLSTPLASKKYNILVDSHFPLSFEINFDAAPIINMKYSGQYSISASIYKNNKLVFITDTYTPVMNKNRNELLKFILLKVVSVKY